MRAPTRTPWRALAVAAVVAGLAGCATVPPVSPLVGQPAVAEPPRIVGARGPLSDSQIQAAVAGLTDTPGQNALLRRHLAIEQAVAETPLVAGESVQLLRDGPAAFRATFAAIAGARRRIDLEYYIFEDVESDGVRLGDLLLAKRAQGVAVNVIYDSVGCLGTPRAFFDRLRQAGVIMVAFNPLNPLASRVPWSPNHRDHRKILIADGATAIIGGVNLARVYEADRPVGAQAAAGPAKPRVRDTDLAFSGPAVAYLEALFNDHWRAQRGPALEALEPVPAPPPAQGWSVMRIIGSTPSRALPPYYVTLISAIRSAQKRITVSAAFFVPTHDELAGLIEAARRGVDVRLLLPEHSGSGLSLAAGRSHYGALLKAGVKIYELPGVTLHAKTVAVDGVWSVIGSSNFDHRSVVFNDEVDAVVLGDDIAEGLEAIFNEDRKAARQIDLETWNHRPLTARAEELFARLWQVLL